MGVRHPDDDVRRAYDELARTCAEHLPDTRAESPLELAVLDDFATTVAGSGPVLDAGCGTGRLSRHLADRGCAVVGVDLSPGMVAAARLAHPDLRFAVAHLARIPHDDEHFAGVLLWYSTIHAPPEQLGPVLREAHRVLRPGGHLVPVDHAAAALLAAGFEEVSRLVRAPRGAERDPQAVLLARRAPAAAHNAHDHDASCAQRP